MSARFLLDTNVISEPLRPAPHPTVLENLRLHQHKLAIPAIAWHELWFGCWRLPSSRRRTVIEGYLREVVAASMPILPYDDAAAEWQAQERARLEALGQPRPFPEGQIAAIALVNGLTLVTFNTADYAGFTDLVVENWKE